MTRLLEHVSLHRVGGTELRVVSDMDSGVGPFVEVETEVIEQYAAGPLWQQETVTLFVLRDLEPLIRQLSQDAALPPGGLAGLGERPIVNVYDINNPGSCHIFVNQKSMEKEGYWGDREAERGLLAHEHAHPLSECETTRSARRLKMGISTDSLRPLFGAGAQGQEWPIKVDRLLEVTVDKLGLYAPREIFANDLTIESGFSGSLLHLNRKNLRNAGESVRSRGALQRSLGEEVEKGGLTGAGAELLLTIADMKGYLDLALETAPFYRQNRVAEAQGLEETLLSQVMPFLAPPVAKAYAKLRDAYVGLPEDASPEALKQWMGSLVSMLAEVLSRKGLRLECRLSVVPE